MAHDDRRHDERLPANGRLRGEAMVFHPVTVVDVSRDGAQIETTFPLQLDSLHQFRISLGDLSVVLRGRIAHCRVGELRDDVAVYRAGVEFVDLSEHARNALSVFVQSLRSATAERVAVVDGEILGGPDS